MQFRASQLPPQLRAAPKLMLYRLSFLQTTASGLCDFIAQCILVRTSRCIYHPFYSPRSSKIYRCWIVWGKRKRVVIFPSFLAIAYLGKSIYLQSYLINRFRFIASSYLVSARWGNNTNFVWYLGEHGDSNKFHLVHGCEHPGDGLDRFQDPHGIQRSWENFGLNRWWCHTSACHIRTSRIRYGVVCHPTCPRRSWQPAIIGRWFDSCF